MAWLEKTVVGGSAGSSVVVFYGGPMPIDTPAVDPWDPKEVVLPTYDPCTVTPSAAAACTVPPTTWTPKQV